MTKILGIHHVTAIAGDPQRNLDFYAGILGLRFVKRTVNFDDPQTYHFYYGDEVGTPGTIMTFFPWPGARRLARTIDPSWYPLRRTDQARRDPWRHGAGARLSGSRRLDARDRRASG